VPLSRVTGLEPLFIPGVLELRPPQGEWSPIVIDSPHSGAQFPEDFGHSLARHHLRAAEDAFVDRLVGDAPTRGVAVLRAFFPRTYIDPNRAADDIDESLLTGPWPGRAQPGPKVTLGVGLIPRLEPGGKVYARHLTVEEVQARLDRYYFPYHRALRETLDKTHDHFGIVWHIDCHSMPSISTAVSPEGPGKRRPDFCLGDRNGTTCRPELTEFIAGRLRQMGHRVTLNDPYKGAELIRRYAAPEHGRHALQLEINRALYMDEERIEPNERFEQTRRELATLITDIVERVRPLQS
jgi:N-formylglutamate amidohydrolase